MLLNMYNAYLRGFDGKSKPKYIKGSLVEQKYKEGASDRKNGLPNRYLQKQEETPQKNIWLEKLKKDLLQNKYNLNKAGLYNGLIKENIENLLKSLKDYDM
jgi:uncharacterized protein YaaW (UPF0174 family)